MILTGRHVRIQIQPSLRATELLTTGNDAGPANLPAGYRQPQSWWSIYEHKDARRERSGMGATACQPCNPMIGRRTLMRGPSLARDPEIVTGLPGSARS